MRSRFKVLFYLKRNKDKDQKVVPVMVVSQSTAASRSSARSFPFRSRFGRSAAAAPRVVASKPIASTAIWITSALRSASTIRIFATGSRKLRPRRSRLCGQRTDAAFPCGDRGVPGTGIPDLQVGQGGEADLGTGGSQIMIWAWL